MNSTARNGIKAVIYDMDGVLIDSEPLWKIAMEEVFHSVGCKLTKKDFEKTVGLRLDEVIHFWYQHDPWKEKNEEEVLTEILDKMVELIRIHGKALEGVIESLTYFKENGFQIGLATSSYEILINAVLDGLKIRSYFDVIHSAEHEKYGKPHPAVYLHTAHLLKVKTTECLVIEDSINGVIAGKAARMKVVCIPEKTHFPNPKLILADEQYDSLTAFIKQFEAC